MFLFKRTNPCNFGAKVLKIGGFFMQVFTVLVDFKKTSLVGQEII